MKKLCSTLAILFILVSSKAQLKKFTVEVPIKPKIEIPESIQSFTLMNRSLTSEFQNLKEDKLQIDFYKKNFKTNFVLLDSTVADTTIKVLGDLLFDSHRFDIVIPVNRNIYRALSYEETPAPLSWNYVESICNTYETDALIVLENLAIRTVTDYESGTELNYGQIYKTHSASMDFYCRAQWRIYDPKNQKIIVDYTIVPDTLYWSNFDYEIIPLFQNLPTIKEASIETAIKVALNFCDLIAPHWIPEKRYYYAMKNSSIDLSIELAANGDWPGALENWLLYINKGNRSNKSKVMLNVALAYEMTGELDQAIIWLKKSQDTYYREVTNYYLKELLKRQILLKE